MLEIEGKLISLDVLEKNFACDLCKCKGACCIHGDSGAPMTEKEIESIQQHYEEIKPYMTEKGIKSIEEQGFFVIDSEHDVVTPLIDNLACAYINYEGDIAFCAIEKAFLDQKIDFHKPLSCHLYPIRVKEYKDFTAINYDKWDICKSAIKNGKTTNTKIYQFLEGPLRRAYGDDFYEQLKYAGEHLDVIINR